MRCTVRLPGPLPLGIVREVLLGLLPSELEARLKSADRARVVTRALARGEDPFTATSVFPGVRKRLAETSRPTPYTVVDDHTAPDGTQKLLLEFGAADLTGANVRRVETVIIPTPNRSTLCVSSQVGCKRACDFCLTATMGLVTNLRADEIVAQYYAALVAGHRPRNVVFMGMGEPLDNFDAVRRAIEVLVHPRAFGLGPRHITLSTVGPSPSAICRLSEVPVRIAWSLHAADDDVRRRLIATHRYAVTELRDAFNEVCARRRAPLFVEVTMIDGHNDHPRDAEAIVRLFESFEAEVRVNLLPMNPIGNTLRPSPSARVEAFSKILTDAGLFTTVRRARGDGDCAACGQLHADSVSKRLNVV